MSVKIPETHYPICAGSYQKQTNKDFGSYGTIRCFICKRYVYRFSGKKFKGRLYPHLIWGSDNWLNLEGIIRSVVEEISREQEVQNKRLSIDYISDTLY